MKYALIQFVLKLSNRIFQRKQNLIKLEGLSAAGNVFSLIFLEMVLAIVSLPLYLNLRPQKVSAYLQEQGGYENITFDYSLRRILTLTGTSVILFLWVLKLLLIFLVPSVFGPLKLYGVSDLRPPDLLSVNKEAIDTQTNIQTAKMSSALLIPELEAVQKSKGKDFVFEGVGQPETTVVLLLSDQQTAVYTAEVDRTGHWQINHLQNTFTLNEGNHSVLTFTFDPETQTKSDYSSEQFFKVKTTFLDVVTRNVDSLANWSIVLVLFVGAFLTFLTI